MQNKTSAGVALFITFAALLLFGYIAFLGAEYLFRGIHQLAIPLTLLGVILLICCVTVMCKSKVSRDKRSGLPREIAAIMVAVLLLGIGSFPFSQFLYVHSHEEDLQAFMKQTALDVSNIDSLYKDYAEGRVRNYRAYLYKNKYSAAGVKQREKSLRRRLIPEEFDTIHAERLQWLSTLTDADVWNISTPRNLRYLRQAGREWTAQYAKVSEVIYQGEKADVFDLDKTAFSTSNDNDSFSKLQSPDGYSILAVIVVSILILVTYLHLRRPKNKYAGNHR